MTTDETMIAALYKHYGEREADEAISAASGDVRAARKALNRQKIRDSRAAEKARRQQRGMGTELYNGPVSVGPQILRLLNSTREVTSSMSGRRLGRATAQGVLTGLPSEMYSSHGDNHVILIDQRIFKTCDGKANAEIVWTGSDYRIHLYRRSPLDSRQEVAIDLGVRTTPAPTMPPMWRTEA